MCHSTCKEVKGQLTFGAQFIPYDAWVLEIELRMSNSVANVLCIEPTYWHKSKSNLWILEKITF